MAIAARAPIPEAPPAYDSGQINAALRAIEQRLENIERAISLGWQMTNVTPTKALDAATADLAATRNALGTLILELIAAGRLGSST
jgi:hypothetical protein